MLLLRSATATIVLAIFPSPSTSIKAQSAGLPCDGIDRVVSRADVLEVAILVTALAVEISHIAHGRVQHVSSIDHHQPRGNAPLNVLCQLFAHNKADATWDPEEREEWCGQFALV